MSAKPKKRLDLLPLCLAVLSAVAAVLFILPQFSRVTFNSNTFNMNGFKLAFGFEDAVKVPGRFYVFLPFAFAILNAAILFALQFVKTLKNKTAPAYLAATVVSFVSVALLIVYLVSVKSIDAGGTIIHNYYFKNIIESSNKDILRGGFTFWFWLGAVLHLLCLVGCCCGAVRKR